MRIFSIQLLVLLAVVTPGISTRAFVDLCETLQRPGVIIPKTSMRLYVHQRQEVRCVLTDTRNLSSRDLTFTLRKKDQTTTESCTLNRMKNITVDHPQILNESTVAWNMSLTTPGIGLLSCMAGQETICTRDVRVGWPAQPPESLQCISHNLEILACSYTTYDNPLLLETMDYRLSVVNTDGNRRYENEFGDQYGCNKEGVYCWNTNVYVANKSFVHLRFDVAEYEPKVFFNFTLNHYEIVIPDPVENLTATEVEPLTIQVNMTVSESLTNLPQGIILRVIATPAEPCCDCFEHQEIFHYPNSNMRNLDVDVSNFKVLLPNTQYLISAALRSGANLLNGQFKSVEQDNYSTPGDNYTAINQGVDWWSHNATTTLKTAATAPWSAPLMHSGAFQWIGENFYVYWQTLLPCHHNGKGFHYLAQLYQGTNRISFGNSEEGLINFKNISKSEKYRVETVSKNDIGSSSNLSTMVVSSDRPTLPDFTVVLRRPGPTQQENHSIYTLRWYDFHFNTTKSYTVFACLGGDIPPDNQEPCKGRLFWMDMNNLSSSVDKGDEVAVYIVNATLQEFGINNHQQQEEESVRFAVSKEAHNGTFSGMIWPTKCPGVQDISSENPKIPFKINTESETATVTWNITCPMPPIYASELQEMVLKYCQGNLTSLENCKGIRRNISNRELAEERLVISGLNSDEQYTIRLLAIYAHGNSSALMTFSTPPADLSWWIIALIVVGTITALISMIIFLFKARKIYAKTKEDLHRELNIPIPKECSTETKGKNRNHILDNTNGFIQTEDIYKKSNMNKSYCDSDQFEYSDDINAYKNSITSEIEVNAKDIKHFSPSALEISESSQEVQVELNGMPSYIAVMSIPQLSQASGNSQDTTNYGTTSGYVTTLPIPESSAFTPQVNSSTKPEYKSCVPEASRLPSPGYVACMPDTNTVPLSKYLEYPPDVKKLSSPGYVTCPPHEGSVPTSGYVTCPPQDGKLLTPGYVTCPPHEGTLPTPGYGERLPEEGKVPTPGYIICPTQAETVSSPGYVTCPPDVKILPSPGYVTCPPPSETLPTPGYVISPPYEKNLPTSGYVTSPPHTETLLTPGYVTCPPHSEILPSPGNVTCPPHSERLPSPGYVTCPPYLMDSNEPSDKDHNIHLLGPIDSAKVESAVEQINPQVLSNNPDGTKPAAKLGTRGYVSVQAMTQFIAGMKNHSRPEVGFNGRDDNVSEFELQDQEYLNKFKPPDLIRIPISHYVMTSIQKNEKDAQNIPDNTPEFDLQYQSNTDPTFSKDFQNKDKMNKDKTGTKYGLSPGYVAVQADDMNFLSIITK